MKQLLSERTARVAIVLWYVVGITGFAVGPLRPLFQALTPFGMLAAALLLFSFHRHRSPGSRTIFAAIAVFGFLIELAGVNTQVFFGHYQYGPALGPKILNTPPAIGINWLVLIYCIAAILKSRQNKWYFSLLGALLMVAFDWVMEPVAWATGMWSWVGGVTLKNYIDWFLVSALLFALIQILRVEINNRMAGLLLFMQFVFFLVLNLLIRTPLWVY
jgi:putative membrane protein